MQNLNTTTPAPLTIGVEPWSFVELPDGSRNAKVGFVPASSPEWDYQHPGSCVVMVRFDRDDKMVSVAPAPASSETAIAAFNALGEAERAELVVIARECSRA